MTKNQLRKTREETFFIKGKGIPKGCKLCLKGAKTVLFLNGICQNPPHCRWYCPLSEERKNKTPTYANEIKINNEEDLIDEINLSKSKGMSITGGDPLYEPNLEKTLSYIKFIKERKGKKFHIHLYTNGLNFNEQIAQKLRDVGLDELRFNPPQDKWFVIELALKEGLIVGAEVPLIPSHDYIKNLERFIHYLDRVEANFINLNEFEMCVTNSLELKERGFNLKKGTMASVEDSKDYALDLIRKLADKISLKIHFCSIRSKDYWQLAKRYTRRAKSINKPYEEVTEDGLILFGQIESHKNNLSQFYQDLSRMVKNPSKNLKLDRNAIELPVKYILNKKIRLMVSKHDMQAFIVEKTPFIEDKYAQITEKIPLDVFLEEQGLNND
jgi:hypothetical protein